MLEYLTRKVKPRSPGEPDAAPRVEQGFVVQAAGDADGVHIAIGDEQLGPDTAASWAKERNALGFVPQCWMFIVDSNAAESYQRAGVFQCKCFS